MNDLVKTENTQLVPQKQEKSFEYDPEGDVLIMRWMGKVYIFHSPFIRDLTVTVPLYRPELEVEINLLAQGYEIRE